MKIFKRLISAVWMLEYESVSNDSNLVKVTNYKRVDWDDVNSFSKEDKEKFENASQTNFQLLEDEGRILTHFVYKDVKYKVSNPKHIFSYSER